MSKGFPPIHGIRWFNVAVLTATPFLALYGLLATPHYNRATIAFAVVYYIFTMLGITAGNASRFPSGPLNA
ncbi:hypothetical protein CC2G_003094 [Coprinopsis cinerea AmutBmut pab1-1]|nr:hypothetical protein CC2G_003094 [Coprinopsis cinerea AmutBmut pab1-1]